MAAEPAAALRRGAELARRAASDLGSQAALALDALARTLGLEALAAEDPRGLPLLGEDPFAALSGQEPAADRGRAPTTLRAGGAPGSGQAPLPPGGAPGLPEGPRGTAAPYEAPRGPGKGPGPGAPAPAQAAARRGAPEPVAGVASQRESSSLGLSDPQALVAGSGGDLGRLVEALAGTKPLGPAGPARAGSGGGASAEPPEWSARRGLEPANAAAGAAGLRGAPEGAPAPGRVPGPDASPGSTGDGRKVGSEGGGSASATAARRGESTVRGGTSRSGGVWDRLAELADEALRGGGGPAGLSDRPVVGAGASAPPAGPAPDSGRAEALARSLPHGREAAAAQAARALAAGALDRAKASASPAGTPGVSLAEAPGTGHLNPDELAELVSDALVRQARRHGVDLS